MHPMMRLAPAAATAGVAAPAEQIPEIDVTGERAGPSLWRVSKGDHVVWLLGTLDPLPKKMTWRSHEVDSVLAQAQEVLVSNPSVSANIGPISAIRLYMQWRRTEKIPERSNLREWLSPELYARFEALKAKYDPHDTRIEELRPLFAARRLYERAIDTAQLTVRNDIQDTVVKLAHKHGVEIRRTSLRLEDPREVLTEVGEIPRAAEIECLEATVERLETDLDLMKARARAWALGDVDALRRLPYPHQREVCLNTVATSPHIKQLIVQAMHDWDVALDTALATHSTSLAMKPIVDLIAPHGTLDALRAKGYTVEGP
jgi:uncharacterized protein YbaP (TraB family)